MRKFEQYRFRDAITPLNEVELNSRFFDLDSRLHDLETLKAKLDESIASLINMGILRIDEAITPKIDEAEQALVDFQNNAQAQFAILANALAEFQAEAQQWINDLQALYEIFQDPVLELSEIQSWKSQLDPQGDAKIRLDKLKGGSTSIAYDAQGRVSEINTTLPYGTYKLLYTYDTDGNVQTEMAKLGQTTLWTKTYNYDQNGQLIGWDES